MSVIRRWISESDWIGPSARSVKRTALEVRRSPTGTLSLINVLKAMPSFAPSSAGSYRARARLAIRSVNETVPALLEHLNLLGYPRVQEMDLSAFQAEMGDLGDAEELQRLLDDYGSDKGSEHQYHGLYSSVLGDRHGVELILEVGIGTNHPDVISSMGSDGTPGASLRAFRDYLPNALVVGADVDDRILFREERIETYVVDQTDASSWARLAGSLPPREFDLVIDDGLHAPNANIRTLTFGLERIKVGGWVIVEDIAFESRPIWELVAAVTMPPQYQAYLVRTQKALVFAVRRLC